jgi:FMN phosphatase YigB (HAD superfamily)
LKNLNSSDIHSWMKKIRLIVLDLDGTLYHDHDFIPRYMAHLVKETRHRSEVDVFIKEAIDILEGRHAVKIGTFYDSLNNVILHRDGNSVVSKFSWEGESLKWLPLAEDDSVMSLHQNHIHYVGDEWGVITVLSRRMGLTNEQLQTAFFAVREEMISPQGFQPHVRLVKSLQNLESPAFRKILITNSPVSTGFDFVRHVGLQGMFDSYIFDGGKPKTLPDHLQAWMRKELLAFDEIVSIGDNAWNDLYPIKQCGGRTVWVSRYESTDANTWDLQVRSLDELADFMETLKHSSV